MSSAYNGWIGLGSLGQSLIFLLPSFELAIDGPRWKHLLVGQVKFDGDEDCCARDLRAKVAVHSQRKIRVVAKLVD